MNLKLSSNDYRIELNKDEISLEKLYHMIIFFTIFTF